MNVTNTILNDTHILIAGTTGSGKSVLLNNIIIGLLKSKNPDFIFIDIKMVELQEYKYIKNCIQYADNNNTIIQAIKKSVGIIEKRFKYMQKNHLKKYNGNDIYIIIDEMADLLTYSDLKKVIYPDLCRILQIGRAAGVHVIACTQDPTKSLLGRIKINFTGIIGLRTATKNESKNIINTSGLEILPEYGTAIYLKNGYKNPFTFNLVNETEKNIILEKRLK